MDNETEAVLRDIQNATHPAVKAVKLSHYISDGLKNKSLSLYEAYHLQEEVICYKREGWLLPAWNGIVSYSSCIEILNQMILAEIFQDTANAKLLREWGRKAYSLCDKKRRHYIMDRFPSFLEEPISRDLLRELSKVRADYESLSDADGPYHVEAFPFHYYEPENIMLNGIVIEKELRENVEELLIALNI